jgi:hypothetical protein
MTRRAPTRRLDVPRSNWHLPAAEVIAKYARLLRRPTGRTPVSHGPCSHTGNVPAETSASAAVKVSADAQASSREETTVRIASSSAAALATTAPGGNVQPRIAFALGFTTPGSALSVSR